MAKRKKTSKTKGDSTSVPTTQLAEQLQAAGVTAESLKAAPVKVATTTTNMGTQVAHAGRAGDLLSAPDILKALEETSHNTYRFMPGRLPRPGDNRILLPSMRYAKWITPNLEHFKVGVGVGPEVMSAKARKAMSKVEGGLVLSDGGVIIPARANKDLETVGVRTFSFKNDAGHKETRQYVDRANFTKDASGVFANPYGGEQQVTVEVWTGDIGRRRVNDTTLQLIQGGVFVHGSVAFNGGDLIANAQDISKATPDSEFLDGPDVEAATTQAEFLGEIPGEVIEGHLRWVVRGWNIRYSDRHSEEVLVRQYNRYFVLFVKNGVLDFYEGTEKQYGERFASLTVEQKLVPVLDQKPTKAKARRRAA